MLISILFGYWQALTSIKIKNKLYSSYWFYKLYSEINFVCNKCLTCLYTSFAKQLHRISLSSFYGLIASLLLLHRTYNAMMEYYSMWTSYHEEAFSPLKIFSDLSSPSLRSFSLCLSISLCLFFFWLCLLVASLKIC